LATLTLELVSIAITSKHRQSRRKFPFTKPNIFIGAVVAGAAGGELDPNCPIKASKIGAARKEIEDT